MITIEQLLESVDLDFEPRFVTKDENGEVWMWSGKPDNKYFTSSIWGLDSKSDYNGTFVGRFQLAEFENKPWSECIYEVPRKEYKYKILTQREYDEMPCKNEETIYIVFETEEKIREEFLKVLLEKDAVNELKGAKNE